MVQAVFVGMASERGGMMDLISRSALIENFKKSGIVDSEDDAWVYSFAIAMIESTPIVDAVPVVHASWIEPSHCIVTSLGWIYYATCSNCGRTITLDDEFGGFCPNCGAKMDGKKVQE